MNGDVEELSFAILLPNNKAGISGCSAVDHDFSWAYGSSFGDISGGNRDAHDRVGEVDKS
jgi:hypothetical protein